VAWNLSFDVPANGRVRKAVVEVRDDRGVVLTTDKADMLDMRERARLAKRLAKRLKAEADDVESKLESGWNDAYGKHQASQAERAAAAAQEKVGSRAEILDTSPEAIRRPLCLVGDHAYAASWLNVRSAITRGVGADREPVTYDPPQVRHTVVLAVLRDDGAIFLDDPAALAGAKPMAELGLEVRLPFQPPPDRCWSGAGVKRFLARERPDPVSVFNRVRAVVNHFMDFKRSFASQDELCELTACYVLATYLLDAFHVIGYLWPNGDKGAGKTSFLMVVTEMAYLGQLVLAGGSYATLRDLADYGATLAFDDAEEVMNVRRFDPDKRALLLAGSRRGACVTVKEKDAKDAWVTRYVNTFCPRCFSAIRLPDDTLASRAVIIPLIRSLDPKRSKAQPMDHGTWPCARQPLVDDLWALGLSFMRELPGHDDKAAAKASLSGRDLEPWRAILAVAHWLDKSHGYEGLFERIEKLSVNYQEERSDLEDHDAVRVALQALFGMLEDAEEIFFAPKELALAMNAIAEEEGLVAGRGKEGEQFTNANKVGWLLKRQRFRKAKRGERSKRWAASRVEVASLARAYGVQTPDWQRTE
jgi:hypothetical protein